MTVTTHNATTPPPIEPKRTVPNGAGISWRIADGYEAVINDEAVGDWFALGSNAQAELVKRNPLREVYRVELARGAFFAKVFTQRGFTATLRRWMVGPPALAEFRTAQALSRVGVGAIRVVAAGVSTWGARSVLVSEEFAGARTLAELWDDRCPNPLRLIACVAAFLARTHTANVLPHDTHADNLLLRPGSDTAEWDIAYADLAGMRIGRPITEQEAARNIAELYQWFRSRTTPMERLRFLRTYLEGRFGDSRNVLQQFAGLIETSATAQQRKLWAKRDRRVFGTNAYFARVGLGDNWMAHLVLRCRGDDPRLVPFQGERTPPQWCQWLSQHLPDLGNEPPAGLPNDLCLYRECARGWQSIWWKLAGSPVRRLFATAQALRHRDLSSLHVPALFEQRLLGKTAQGVLLIHRPAACQSLMETLRGVCADEARAPAYAGDRDERSLIRHLLGTTGRLLADMVLCGVAARHLTLETFAVMPGADPHRPTVCIADFRGLTVRRRPMFAAVAWMPACLLRICPRAITRTDRLRFLLAYWRRLPRERQGGSWKHLWEWIEIPTER